MFGNIHAHTTKRRLPRALRPRFISCLSWARGSFVLLLTSGNLINSCFAKRILKIDNEIFACYLSVFDILVSIIQNARRSNREKQLVAISININCSYSRKCPNTRRNHRFASITNCCTLNNAATQTRLLMYEQLATSLHFATCNCDCKHITCVILTQHWHFNGATVISAYCL